MSTDADAEVGHRAVLGVEQVGGRRRPERREGAATPLAGQQAPILQRFDAREALPPEFALPRRRLSP